MTTGTKVFLAVFAGFIGVLVLYYGVIMPRGANAGKGAPVETSGADKRGLAPLMTTTPKASQESNQTNSEAANPVSHPNLGSVDAVPPKPELDTQASGRPVANDPPAKPINGNGPERSISRSPLDMFPVGLTPNAATHAESGQPVGHAGSAPGSGAGAPSDVKSIHPQPTSAIPAGNIKSGAAGAADGKTAPKSPATATDNSRKSSSPATFDYIVKSGDTMSSIAEEWFGDRNKWSLIAKENPLDDPDHLHVGQKLRLPPKDAQPAKVKDAIAPGKSTYIVRSGDTLAKIARDLYNDVSKWQAIYDANKSVIGPDPADLKAGMKLKIPEIPMKSPETMPKSS